ncbi:GPI-anchored wall transfer protein 1 [Xylona heveae TC161]|uniref:GPI-anchored wall transfer protein n=1 Tax=Xylona heveae (strain CBS 132557 / TC161) TaxID=1328760 RepID=A0A165GC68_XYLHT|nr:GPI-anchored wall transfer protein 1 [Xylona heveae TC161]KZF22015.1 GPI-anchored wall transfer protein 1 [Xylona heveae TC161]
MAKSYKSLKEDFVSNLTGGDISEINYVTFVAPAAALLWSSLQSRQKFFLSYGPTAFVTDFLLNCGAILFAITSYSSAPILLNILLLTPALLLYAFPPASPARNKKLKPRGEEKERSKNDHLHLSTPKTGRIAGGLEGDHTQTSESSAPQLDPFPIRPFLTTYRGTMLIITAIAILAVDFRVFPRRFAKVETWGTSLMDLGVGSFVFSAGVVSAKDALKTRLSGSSVTLKNRLLKSIRHSLPLMILGLIRLYSVKGLDYAEHVTEYGVHWNFFFTLGLLPPFVALCDTAFRFIPSYTVLSIIVGLTYEVVLQTTSLQAFVLTAPRKDLFSQNREGIFSFFGYLAIFLAGESIGMYALPRHHSGRKDSSPNKERKRLIVSLLSQTALWTGLFYVCASYKYGFDLRVSRRLANLPYFLWVTAFNCGQIFLFCVIETLCFPGVHTAADRTTERARCDEATSRVLRAYNRNGLGIFLLANLLTGLVNIALPTLTMGPLPAMATLLGYTSLLTGVAAALDQRGISIKL